MEGFSFVTPVTGLNRPNTGKEDNDEYICYCSMRFHLTYFLMALTRKKLCTVPCMGVEYFAIGLSEG
jgi:hypothetical protein